MEILTPCFDQCFDVSKMEIWTLHLTNAFWKYPLSFKVVWVSISSASSSLSCNIVQKFLNENTNPVKDLDPVNCFWSSLPLRRFGQQRISCISNNLGIIMGSFDDFDTSFVLYRVRCQLYFTQYFVKGLNFLTDLNSNSNYAKIWYFYERKTDLKCKEIQFVSVFIRINESRRISYSNSASNSVILTHISL